jgi:hypothetical protein
MTRIRVTWADASVQDIDFCSRAEAVAHAGWLRTSVKRHQYTSIVVIDLATLTRNAA